MSFWQAYSDETPWARGSLTFLAYMRALILLVSPWTPAATFVQKKLLAQTRVQQRLPIYPCETACPFASNVGHDQVGAGASLWPELVVIFIRIVEFFWVELLKYKLGARELIRIDFAHFKLLAHVFKVVYWLLAKTWQIRIGISKICRFGRLKGRAPVLTAVAVRGWRPGVSRFLELTVLIVKLDRMGQHWVGGRAGLTCCVFDRKMCRLVHAGRLLAVVEGLFFFSFSERLLGDRLFTEMLLCFGAAAIGFAMRRLLFLLLLFEQVVLVELLGIVL